MGQELSGKVAIVTGGASGIGRATAELFVEEGAQVVMADVDAEQGEELSASLGGAAAFQPTDVSDADDVQALVDFTVGHFGGLDVMFNNAGIPSSFRRILDNDLARLPPGDGRQPVRRHGRHAARGTSHGGARRRFHHQHLVDRRAQWRRRADHLPRVEGRRRAVQPIRRHRPRRPRDPGQLHRARSHRHRDQQLRHGPGDPVDPAAPAARRPDRRRQRGALPGERPRRRRSPASCSPSMVGRRPGRR